MPLTALPTSDTASLGISCMDSGTSMPTVMVILPLSRVAVGGDAPCVAPASPPSPPLDSTDTPLLPNEEDEEEDEEEEKDDDVAVAEANDDVADDDAE